VLTVNKIGGQYKEENYIIKLNGKYNNPTHSYNTNNRRSYHFFFIHLIPQ